VYRWIVLGDRAGKKGTGIACAILRTVSGISAIAAFAQLISTAVKAKVMGNEMEMMDDFYAAIGSMFALFFVMFIVMIAAFVLELIVYYQFFKNCGYSETPFILILAGTFVFKPLASVTWFLTGIGRISPAKGAGYIARPENSRVYDEEYEPPQEEGKGYRQEGGPINYNGQTFSQSGPISCNGQTYDPFGDQDYGTAGSAYDDFASGSKGGTIYEDDDEQ
jgi:hypothetical protein